MITKLRQVRRKIFRPPRSPARATTMGF